MFDYVDVVVGLNFIIDWLLLIGANRLCGFPTRRLRAVLAAGLGAIYAGVCSVPRFYLIGGYGYRILILVLMGLICFGFHWNAVRRTVVFLLLCMALGGIVSGMNRGGAVSLVAAAVALSLMCAVGFRGDIGSSSYVPVELSYGGKRVRLTALADTGNTLRDPVTGRSVLVVGAQVAETLFGLSSEQLRKPVETMQSANIAGLRLIPYTSIGQPAGFMLAVRIQNVTVGNWKGSALVAFAPEKLGVNGYQALAGGNVG